jgi:hypothetical protein
VASIRRFVHPVEVQAVPWMADGTVDNSAFDRLFRAGALAS